MDGWSQNIDRLLLKHHWLLLFSLPKLLKLSQLLRSAFQPDYDANKIMYEIGFLFRSEVKARKQLLRAIKVIIIALTLHLQTALFYFFLHFAGFLDHITNRNMHL